MVMIPIMNQARLAAAAAGAAGVAKYPDIHRDTPLMGDGDDDYSYGGRSNTPSSGFTYQGKAYDPILNEPMVVEAEIHGDFWEDDMDHSEAVSYENIQSRTDTKTDEKSCQSCPPDGKVMPMVRRCSRWSAVTINYQTRICGTFYNPDTQQIQEFKYCGVSFDGWKEALCQFWEAKARYDQFFDMYNEPKTWWKGVKSAISQAGRHQAVTTVNQPLKVVWIFMQPISYNYFTKIFRLSMPDIMTKWVP
jgi:hypothetical protein